MAADQRQKRLSVTSLLYSAALCTAHHFSTSFECFQLVSAGSVADRVSVDLRQVQASASELFDIPGKT